MTTSLPKSHHLLLLALIIIILVSVISTNCELSSQQPTIKIKDEKLRKLLNRDRIEIGQLFNMYQGRKDIKFVNNNNRKATDAKFSPLIAVGGLGGSALMSKRDHAVNEPHWWCEKTTRDPFQIWMSLEELVPFFTEDCFVHDMSIELKDGLLRQKDSGVRIFGKDIGGMGGLESVFAQLESKAYYMKYLSDYLVKYGNFQIGKSLRGLTIDWRLGVKEWSNNNNTIGGDFYTLKSLVEDTYYKNGNLKVSLLGHSMGGPFLQYFLANFVNQVWKDQYISNFIPLSGAFDGSPIALILYMTGTNWGLPIFELENARKILHQYPSPLYMSPNYSPFQYPFFTYNNTKVVKNYESSSLADIEKFMTDAKIKNGFELYQHEYSAYKYNKIAAPNVTTHCLYGYGIPTITHVEYSGPKEMSELNFNDLVHGMNILKVEDGDGVVPSYSLQICDEFAKYQKQPVYIHRFFNASHTGIIYEEKTFETLLEILKVNN